MCVCVCVCVCVTVLCVCACACVCACCVCACACACVCVPLFDLGVMYFKVKRSIYNYTNCPQGLDPNVHTNLLDFVNMFSF